MLKVDVSLDSTLVSRLQSQINSLFGDNAGEVFPATKAAFDSSARLIQKAWQGWATGESIEGIPDIKRPNSRLASSIKINSVSSFDSVIGTESEYAKRIESGTPEIDMKKTYPYGRKSRVSKKNIPYLIIPFRWGTPNSEGGARARFGNTIPKIAYDIMKSFSRSKRLSSTHFENNAGGESIRRSEYTWGDRLKDEGNINGMVKMTSEFGKESTYFTFRVISIKSPQDKWIRKAVPAVDVASAIEKASQSAVEEIIQKGLENDLG